MSEYPPSNMVLITHFGRWVSKVRSSRKGIAKGKLTHERIVSLNAIGFFWGKNQPVGLTDAEKEKFGITS